MSTSTPEQELGPAADASAAEPNLSFWQVVRLSLKGQHLDYTAVPLNRAVLLLAVPMVLEMIMESLFAVVDVFWVSRLGSDAIAVVGLTESIMTLIYAVAIGISIAATAIVSRRIGEKDPERAAQAAGQIVLLGVTVSAAIGLVLSYFASDILRLMGASDSVVALGTDFARVMLGCNVTVFMIFLINAIFRGAGDAVLAMRTLWLANALNIVLGPFFIFGWGPFPELGVTGAAVATNIGRGVGVLYQLWHLAGFHSRVQVRMRHLKPVWLDLRAIMNTASTGIAQLLIGTTSWVGLFKILAAFGSAALAGYTIAMRIVMFALMPAWGLANAGATLVGQNLGAGKPDRAEQAIWIATRFNVIFLGVVGLLFVLGSGPLVRLFTDDPPVLEHGIRALWIVSLAFPLYAAGMCLEAAFNGAGDTWTPTRLNFFCFWLGQIPLAWLLADFFAMGPLGVFIAVPIAFSVLALWSLVLFRRGRWKQQQV
ncbi:MATE family efflux transporter [Steroidobacter agaridevorans]|uniref:Multidrug-efflux transporter n=1 Tax=Steroidobacter agaridevorans TaxID=2695856 RepID=A0A829Y6J9_9GAMM|nr:MATE family efflux transporter [Steroidobacter agaridevorans]GFE78884.1 MATE family efflux transporter [Steroidobacter agaridevorans]GFE88038.1 MATE family efflux transporter [Steroidobacter agaridevorans]